MIARNDWPLDVVVAICTYRRPALLASLLQAVAGQEFPDGSTARIGILVVDNSPRFEAAQVVESFSAASHLPVEYVRHGARNIASGRNELLRRGQELAPLLAFVDDDELPEPSWLHHLVEAQRRTGADVVTGPVLAQYPAGAPAWLQHDDFYSVLGPAAGGPVHEAVTGNALVRTQSIAALDMSFDDALGQSGGEDQLFFRALRARGASLYFAPAARVAEVVPGERLRWRYLLRREYRKGNTLGLLDRSRPGWPTGRPVRRVASAAWWAGTGLVRLIAAVVMVDRTQMVRASMRLARSSGMLAGLRGQTFDHYVSARVGAVDGTTVALVVPEDPSYQSAGHSHFLKGFVSHYRDSGARVVIVVTSGRLGFVLRRAPDGEPEYRSAALRTVGRWQVVTSLRAVLGTLSWSAFRRAPRPLQRSVDRARTAVRSRRHVDHRLGSFLDDHQTAFVEDVLASTDPDVVLFSSIFSVPRPLRLPESVRASVLLTHDVVSERAQQFRDHGYRVLPAGFIEDSERQALKDFDGIVAIQWDDASALRRLAPHAKVLVVPVAVTAQVSGARQPLPDRCLFVGSGSLANVEGLLWFLEQCWPRVRARRPGAELHVVGTVCARVDTAAPGVHLRGEVADLPGEYAQCALALVPLRTGSGLKVKLVEAVGHSVAVITTSVGAQGLSHLTPQPFALADDAADFADAVVRVLEDDGHRRGLERSAEACASLFSPERAFAELDAYLQTSGVALDRPSTA